MQNKNILIILILFTLILFSNQNNKNDINFYSKVKKYHAKPDIIKENDILFSSRWKHPVNKNDPYDSFKAAADFHATGFYWVYTKDIKWIKEIKEKGYLFQGSLNTILTDSIDSNKRDAGRILDQNGNKIAAPWMTSWNGYWGCVNSPQYRKTFFDHAKIYIDAGTDLLHMDDPKINFAALAWGGCYCRYCIEKAEKLGKTPKEIQKESVDDFYKFIIPELDAYAKKHIPFSSNNYSGDLGFPQEYFDFGIAELSEKKAKPDYIFDSILNAKKIGKKQIFTFVSSDKKLTRETLALTYASGGHMLVPWDIYIPPDKPRYYGKPEEYSDLTGFIRGNAKYFNGFENVYFLIKNKKDTRYSSEPMTLVKKNSDINVFIRIIPDNEKSPIVIHLVDQSKKPEKFSIRLNKKFFPDNDFIISLMTPISYNSFQHSESEKSKDFKSLFAVKKYGSDLDAIIDIPELNPWGILVIERK